MDILGAFPGISTSFRSAMAPLARPWAPSVALVLLALQGASFVGPWPAWTRRRTRRLGAGPGGVLPDGRLRDAYGWRDDIFFWQFFFEDFEWLNNG